MNRLIFFITFCISSNLVFAKCGFTGIEVFPKSEEIFTNSNIIINGSYEDIDRIQKKTNAYLMCENQKVGFNILKVNNGYNLHQIILKPYDNLIKGKKYQFIIENQYSSNYVFKDNKLVKDIKEVYKEWMVSQNDFIFPVFWLKPPTILSTDFQYYGCGPSKNFTFSINTLGKSDNFYINVSIKKKGSKIERTFATMLDKSGKIMIGHNMCSGQFSFADNEHYIVKFELVDFTGNVTKDNHLIEIKTPKMDANI